MVAPVNGVPAAVAARTVRITVPTRCTAQSGLNNVGDWTVTWDTQERWENDLMGWSST